MYSWKKRSLITIAALVVIPLSVGAVAASATVKAPAVRQGANARLFVGFSSPGLIDGLQRTWAQWTCKTVEAVGGKCTITNAENSDQKQNQDVQDLMADGVNVLVIDPNGGAAIVPVIKEANAKHIPVFTVDNMADGGKVVSAIHTDNYEAGYGAAQFCAKKHGGKGDVAELQGLAGAQNVITRNAGWLAGLKKSPGLHLVYNEYTSWSTATAFADTQDLLEAHPNIACIWTQADIVAMGAAEAVSKIHKSNSVTIIGMGMYDGGPQAIAAGTITASWYMEPQQTGQAAGRAVLEYWDGKTTPAQINVPLTFVTKANVAQFSGDPDVGVVK